MEQTIKIMYHSVTMKEVFYGKQNLLRRSNNGIANLTQDDEYEKI